jgi:SAM-dependent methyltransferase
VAAATALNAPLGSLYAFSVFLKPLEALLGVSRGDLATVFAFASAGFGVGMNLAPYVFGLASPAMLVLACAAVSAVGVAIAASAGGLLQLAIGYGVLFGIGGGAAYILAQQAVNMSLTSRHGLVNGYIVSLYPAGAMIAAPVFGWSIAAFGVRATLGGFAVVLALTGALSAWLISHPGLTLPAASSVEPAATERRRAVFWRLCIVFFLAASAGLMVLSQAAGIIAAYGGTTALAVYGTTFIAASIAVARVGGGWMVDWLTIPGVAAGAHAVALAGNLALTVWPGAGVSVLALTLVGIGYGIISGLTAAAVAVYWRRALYGRMASRIYLAWCAAAIVLPIAAGRLFDLTQGYGVAILIAAGGNVLGIAVALGLPSQRAEEARGHEREAASGRSASLSEAWEREAAQWIAWARAPGHDSYWRFHRDQFLELVPAPGRLTLDIGCGEGRLTRDLSARGHTVVALDASPTMISAAREADPTGDYRVADAAKLPVRDAVCDLAIAFMSLQDLDDMPGAVAEIGRVLMPGACVCLAVVHPLNSAGKFADEAADSPFIVRGSYLGESPYRDVVSRDGHDMTFHSRHRPLESYSRALEAAGLYVDAIREHPMPASAIHLARSLRWTRVPLFLHLRARKPPISG